MASAGPGRTSRCSLDFPRRGPGSGHSSSSGPAPDGWARAWGVGRGRPPGDRGPEARLPVGVGAVEGERSDRAGAGAVGGAVLHDAERVAVGVREHHPGDVALTDVDAAGAQPHETLGDSVLLLGAPQVEVEPLGDVGGRRGGREAEVEEHLRREVQARLEAVVVLGQHVGAEGLGPEVAERARIGRVPDDVLEPHGAILPEVRHRDPI
ncbi:hypothetical protein ASF35_06260 [Aeromicrobium sp. Leaf291]|nr:hypothetical protein ASF35_06260 [Aeromicrobium sp. Leaf291]